jgi:DNA-binding MarR family transcriptional regulator
MATRVRARPQRRSLARRRERQAAAESGSETPAGSLDEAPVALPRRQFERLLTLARVAEPGLEMAPVPLRFVRDGDLDRSSIRLARAIHQLRRRRELYFDAGLFSDPAWDLLLHLHVASGEEKWVHVSRACRAAAVPTTTALRWLGRLEALGLVLRESDPRDRRRMKVCLAPEASRAMRRLLHDIRTMLETNPEPQ